ncbi:MAG: HAD-IA family hydrolase, partial [Candidatus Babeliales bacterium]
LIFTPEEFYQMMKFNSNAIKFVKKCKENGHQVYVLSNWDKESFGLLRKKYQNIFDLFDGIIISGEHCSTKPSKKIYQKLITQYNLNPEECIFFDDQLENCIAAKAFGIAFVHYKKDKKLFNSKRNRNKIFNHIETTYPQKNKNFSSKKNTFDPAFLLSKKTYRLSCLTLNNILSK